MNIFIYGNASFKSDIHKVFERSNIKFRLKESDSIQEIQTLIELRTAIENHPLDVFLIDDAKIFRKNALNEKMKFLKPKGSIEEEFIKSHGIDDISIDSLADLPSHIIKKLEEEHGESIDDDYHSSRDDLDIQESIIGIVDDAYSNEEMDEYLTKNDNIGDIDEENDKILLDEELSSLLSGEDNDIDDSLEEFEEEENSYEDESKDEDKFEDEGNPSEDEPFKYEEEQKDENSYEIIKGEGENMSDEFSELDNLNESDILAALDGLEDININSIEPAQVKSIAQNSNEMSQSNVGVEGNGSNVNEIAALITSLLNNKTLEITIKVKA